MPANVVEKIAWLKGQIYSRQEWLDTHGHKIKWPEHDIEAKRHGLTMLEDICSDYEKSLERAMKAKAEE